MHDADEQFEQEFSGLLRRYARAADRPIDPSMIASGAMLRGRGRPSLFAWPRILRGASGVAWAGALVGLLLITVIVATLGGGRPEPVPVITSPSPSAIASAAPSASSTSAPTASPAPTVSAPVPTTTPGPTPTTAPSVSAPVTESPPIPSALPTTAPSSPAAGRPMPAGFQPLSVTFVSPDEGWVLGTCGSPTCPAIGHTLDGGRHWSQVGVPATTARMAPPEGASEQTGIDSIRFASPRDGWAYGPELWQTHDGGDTWTRVNLPDFPAGSAVLALETARGSTHAVIYNGQASFRILTTPSNADRWQLAKVELPVGAGPVPTIQLVLSGEAGWILQNDRTVVNGARLVAGAWQAWQPACADVVGPAYLAASSAKDLVAACDVGLWSTPQGGHLYVSHDGGMTFKPAGATVPFMLGGAIATPGTSTIALSGLDTGGGVGLEASFDGGATWTTVVSLGRGSVSYVGFTTALQGVLIGAASPGPTMRMTRDGGHTWEAVTF